MHRSLLLAQILVIRSFYPKLSVSTLAANYEIFMPYQAQLTSLSAIGPGLDPWVLGS